MRADEEQVGGDHYKRLKITPWEYMEANFTHEEFVGYLKGNIIKYCTRQKGSDDLEKAAHYAKKLQEVLNTKRAEQNQVSKPRPETTIAPGQINAKGTASVTGTQSSWPADFFDILTKEIQKPSFGKSQSDFRQEILSTLAKKALR